MNTYIVPVDTEIKRFEEHINLSENKRILFSAPFGSGKSSFLQTFFNEHEKYILIKIFPTNYSVASNNDIFELIKFDILTSIFEDHSGHLTLNFEDFDQFLIAQMYILHKMEFYPLMQSALKAFSEKTKAVGEVIESFNDFFQKFKQYKKEVNNSDENSIIEYLTSFKVQRGSIKEHDFFTNKINEFLKEIKKESKKEVVLLIDDIDRLDAEHVFRIFNIFTAHYDSSEKNKFGFDKLIFVCDVNTIEHLFYHKYGSKAEFNGYIDKFYSQSIFVFDNKKYLKENIVELLKPKNELNASNLQNGRFWESVYGFNSSEFFYIFLSLVRELIDKDYIKIRNFNRFQEYSLPNSIIRFNRGDESGDNYRLIVLIHILSQFFPRIIDLEQILFNLSEDYKSDVGTTLSGRHGNELERLLIQYSIPFLGFYEDPNDRNQEKQSTFISEKGERIIVIYKRVNNPLDGGMEYERCLTKINSITTDLRLEGPIIYNPNPFWFLYRAVVSCKNRKVRFKLLQF